MQTKLGHLTREKNPGANGREAEFLNHVFVRLGNGRRVLLSLTDYESARAMKRGNEFCEPAEPKPRSWIARLFLGDDQPEAEGSPPAGEQPGPIATNGEAQ